MPNQLEWPIDRQANPAIHATPQNAEMRSENIESVAGPLEAGMLFDHAQAVRSLLMTCVRPNVVEDFNKSGYMTVWPTKSCPIGCEFCFFHSPIVKIKDPENSLTAEGIQRLLTLIKEANVQRLMISGGGEPFMVFEQSMSTILRSADVESILIATGADWARKRDATEERIRKVLQYRDENKRRPRIDFRISLDKYHAEKISPDGGLEYLSNVIDVFSNSFADSRDFLLSFRALHGDATVQNLLRMLPVEDRIKTGDRTEQVNLKSGFSFPISYNAEFVSDSKVDLNDSAFIERQAVLWDRNIKDVYGGNMSVIKNADGRGLNMEVLHNGEYFPWGGCPPDNELSIYKDDYREFMRRVLGDTISLSVLEKGNEYRDAVVAEVNPRAVMRGKAMGIRDFYPRVIFEEEKTRLYYAIRATQDYIAEDRVGQIRGHVPRVIEEILGLSKETLIDLYRSSKNNIVQQYLGSEHLTVDHLQSLLKTIRLGHYDISEAEMIHQVKNSGLNNEAKATFLQNATNSRRKPL